MRIVSGIFLRLITLIMQANLAWLHENTNFFSYFYAFPQVMIDVIQMALAACAPYVTLLLEDEMT